LGLVLFAADREKTMFSGRVVLCAQNVMLDKEIKIAEGK